MPVTLHSRRLRWQVGFTLIELMITLAIVAILSSIAAPAYTSYIARSRRADARVQLVQAAQFMQRFYTANDRFDQDRAGNSVSSQIPANLKQSPADGSKLYNLLDLVAGDAISGSVTVTPSDYKLTMAPVSGTSMAADACGSFTLTAAGVRGVTGTLSRDTCWK